MLKRWHAMVMMILAASVFSFCINLLELRIFFSGASDALSQNPIRISTDSETHSSHISNLTVTKKSICLLNGNSKNLGDTMTTAGKYLVNFEIESCVCVDLEIW